MDIIDIIYVFELIAMLRNAENVYSCKVVCLVVSFVISFSVELGIEYDQFCVHSIVSI